MNERIKGLIEQCETTYSDRNEDGRIYTEFDKEKFAELIVKECANIAFDLGLFAGRAKKMERCRGCTDVGKLIKKSFGVKE